MSVALLIARLILGLGMAAHGAQKLFGWFGGPGLEGAGGFFAQLGFRPGPVFAFLAGCAEFGGGLLLAFGLLGPIGPALIILVTAVAILTVHLGHGFFASTGGAELPLVYAAGALVLAFTGPGTISLDAILGLGLYWTTTATWLIVAAALLLALANVLVRRPTGAAHPGE